jgi:antitoxin CptB
LTADFNRLRWRCRRGMLELDAWLEGFLETGYRQLDPTEQGIFGRLLDQEDMDLLAWLSGQSTAPAEFAAVIEKIRKVTQK